MLIFIIIVVAILIDMIIAGMFFAVATEKGYFGSRYFWICFFLGIVGYIYVAALPDLRARPQTVDKRFDKTVYASPTVTPKVQPSAENTAVSGIYEEETDTVNLSSWFCKKCQTQNTINRVCCTNCNTNKYAGVANPPKYICGKCGYDKDFSGNCPNCQSSVKVYTRL